MKLLSTRVFTLGQKNDALPALGWLVVCGLMLTLLPGCSTPTSPVNAPVAAGPAAPAPVHSVDAAAARRLISAWTSQGLKAEAEYEQLPGKPADRIEWKSMTVVLSSDLAQADAVMTAVGQFAARGAKPMIIHLYARNRKQDGVLSQALKKGAVQSGGRNSVKLEHHIHPDFPVRVQLSIREGA